MRSARCATLITGARDIDRQLCIADRAFLVHGLFEAELYFGALAGLVFFPPALLLWSAASVYQAAELEDRWE
jgi:hypothetical protein